MNTWSDLDLRRAKTILAKYTVRHFREAVGEIERAIGREVTPHALRSVFLRNDLGPPSSYCIEDVVDEPENGTFDDDAEPVTAVRVPDLMERFVNFTKRGPIEFADLCNKLDLSPAKARGLIEQARAMGIKVHVEHNHVGIHFPQPDDQVHEGRVKDVGIAPVIGERQKVAVISDTHLGSKYCLREQLRDFIHHAYAQGVREILHPGDVLDGMYKHGVWEVSHSGLDAQAQDLFETLPHLPGLNYRCITGNHDWTFTEASGVDVGDYLVNYFRKRGRDDLHFYGNRGAFIRVCGAVVHLWHPRSGVSYARSYAIQKHIEKYSSGEKPSLLLAGHWHVYVHCFERGVHGIACPTFQGGGSAFSKSLGGAPAIGGLILSWGLTEHRTMRDFVLEYRTYYERETLVRLDGFNEVKGNE